MNRAESGFARVYDEHIWAIYGFLAYRVRQRETAEDLTQATFERALRSWGRFDPRRGSERTWLLAIANNLLIDHYRSRDRRTLALIDERGESAESGPEEQLGFSAELEHALSQLSEREREVLALRYGGDLNGPEVAGLLGLSVANVQQIASRALRKLRALLEADERAQSASSAARPINSSPSTR